MTLSTQNETGKTVLAADDKLDDGNPIVLKVTISEEDVSHQYVPVVESSLLLFFISDFWHDPSCSICPTVVVG